MTPFLNQPRYFDDAVNLLDEQTTNFYDCNDTYSLCTHPKDFIAWGLRHCGPEGEYHLAEAMQRLLDDHVRLRADAQEYDTLLKAHIELQGMYVTLSKKHNQLKDAVEDLVDRNSKI